MCIQNPVTTLTLCVRVNSHVLCVCMHAANWRTSPPKMKLSAAAAAGRRRQRRYRCVVPRALRKPHTQWSVLSDDDDDFYTAQLCSNPTDLNARSTKGIS